MTYQDFSRVAVRQITQSLDLASVAAEDSNGVFTAATTDILTDTTHGLSTGDAVRLTTDGTLPAGLALLTTYYVGVIDANTFYLFRGEADARAGGSGAVAARVDVTDTGSGIHTWHKAAGVLSQDVAVDGASGSMLHVTPPALTAGLVFVRATVPSQQTIKLSFHNFTSGAIDESAATWNFLCSVS